MSTDAQQAQPDPTAPRALVLASAERGEHGTAALLGLQVTERVVVNLQHRGVDQVTLAGSRLVLPDSRREGVRFLEQAAPGEVDQIRQVLGEEPGDLFVASGDLVYHPDLPTLLRQRAASEQRSQVAWESSAHPLLYLRREDAEDLPEAGDLEAFVGRLLAAGTCQRVEQPDHFAVAALEQGDRQRAARLLLKLNWRPHDGIVARYVNKHISVRISSWLSSTPITPNQMTVLAFMLAMVGVGLATVGTYLTFVAGALLVQIQSVLDGCDGELSRMRYQASRTGAWLDTIVDDVIGTLWVCALGYGLYRGSGQMVYLATGLGAGTAHLISTVLLYTAIIQHGGVGHQDFVWWWEEKNHDAVEDENKASPFGWVKYLARRDFYVLVYLGLALLNLMPVALLLAALGSLVGLVVTLIQIYKRGFAMRPEAAVSKQKADKVDDAEVGADAQPAPPPAKSEAVLEAGPWAGPSVDTADAADTADTAPDTPPTTAPDTPKEADAPEAETKPPNPKPAG
jgi:phosphatidylglycerophosphate synthase